MIKNKEKNFISAVIYVYNNEDEIQDMLKNVNEVLKERFNKYEIICVNDASTDDSVNKIKEFAKTLENEVLSVINMSYYQGVELAMNAGVDMAIGDFVYEFDTMISEDEKQIVLDVYDKCLKGFDIVSASYGKSRNKFSAIFYKIFNRYSNTEYKINTENFRILSRRAINRVHSISATIPYRKAIYANCGLKTCNIEYKGEDNRKKKTNKQVQKTRMETATSSLILFTNIGYKFSLAMSAIMILATILVALYAVIIFVKGNPVQGWTTTMLFLSFAFFGLFMIMSIVLKYLEILINLTFKKCKYMIESIDKLN